MQAAAHQLVYGVWNLGSFAHVTLEQAALAFVPPALARRRARETVGLLLGLAVAIGLLTALVSPQTGKILLEPSAARATCQLQF